jgi:hypothetical protein
MSSHLSSADTAWLRMDRPTNLMVITSVMLFDEPVDIEQIRHVYHQRLVGRYPRFRQRVVESGLPLRPPHSPTTDPMAPPMPGSSQPISCRTRRGVLCRG